MYREVTLSITIRGTIVKILTINYNIVSRFIDHDKKVINIYCGDTKEKKNITSFIDISIDMCLGFSNFIIVPSSYFHCLY